MKRWTTCAMIIGLALGATQPAAAQGKEEDRLRESGTVLREVLGMPDGVPKNLLDRAECVVVFPSVKKFAIGVGGSYGRGVIACRTREAFDGPWSAPAFMALEGGSIGLQLGGQATDFVLLIMNERGASSVLTSKVKIGADASAAAGPKGRTAGASTDIVMRAEILTYSRSRGLFAGVSLEGSTLRVDGEANEKVYGRPIDAREIVKGSVPPPAAASRLVDTLNTHSPRNLSERPSI